MILCNVCGRRPPREGGADCDVCRDAWERAQRSPGFVPTVELFGVPVREVEGLPDDLVAIVLPYAPHCEANGCGDCGGSLSVSCPWLVSRETNNFGPMFAAQLDLFRATQETLNLQRPDHE